MSSKFAKGALIITVATILSKILGSLFRIPLQNIAGDEVLGIFTIIYPVYMSVLIITVAGIPIAISKLISEARARNQNDEVEQIFKTAKLLGLGFGFISFVAIILFSEKASLWLGWGNAHYALNVVAVSLVVAPYMATYRGYFQGFENMKPTAISQVLEQFVRVVVILVTAYVLTIQQQSSEIVGAGIMVGSILGVVVSLMYLQRLYKKTKQFNAFSYNVSIFRLWSKKILVISVPICVGALTMALLNVVDSITVPQQLLKVVETNEEVTLLFGIYGRGLALVQIAVVFASALVLPLIPLISVHLAKGEQGKTKETIEKAMKYTHFTSWPIVVGLVVLTMPINLALFTDLQGSMVIAILSLSALFTAFSVLTTGILQGLNKANEAAFVVLLCTFFKFLVNIMIVENWGITGAAISTLITYVLLTALNFILIFREIRFQLAGKSEAVIIGSSIVMGLVVGAPLFVSDVRLWTRVEALFYVAIMGLVGTLIYGVFVIWLKGLSDSELKSMPLINKYLVRK